MIAISTDLWFICCLLVLQEHYYLVLYQLLVYKLTPVVTTHCKANLDEKREVDNEVRLDNFTFFFIF